MRIVLNGGLWFVIGMVVAAVAAARLRHDGVRALSCFYGCVIGVLGVGHLAAIVYLGIDRWSAYAVGGAIAAPSFVLAIAAPRASYATLRWLHAAPLVLMLTGPPTFLLAIPAVLDLLYLSRPRRGLLVASAAIYALMFVGGVIAALLLGASPATIRG